MEKETKHTPEDIKKEAEEALAEHEGGNLALWEVPQNASEREYWKGVWMLGRMKSFASLQTELSEMKKENHDYEVAQKGNLARLDELNEQVSEMKKEREELVRVLRELTDYLPSVFSPDDLNDLPVLLEAANKVLTNSKDRHETLLESERYRDLGLSIQRHFQTLIARNYDNIGKWSNERQDYNFQLISELEELLKNHNQFITRIKK